MHPITPTEDGSVTLYVPLLNEHYHSIHGAIQESRHIFIRAGIEHFLSVHPATITADAPLRILEAGFGTGLNAYLTLLYADEHQLPVDYHSLEKYPLPPDETDRLNYPRLLPAADPSLFRRLHNVAWEQEQTITPCFRLCKHHADFRALDAPAGFHLVFFDAFNPDVQPHLWTPDVLERFYRALLPGGLLVTYCVKGIVKQALRQVGFTLSRLPGPPGKREMLRAAKPPLIVP